MRFNRLKVKGYKCLADVDLELRDLMVLIGPNGAGKTALLEIFALLRDAAQDRFDDAIAERGGINSILFKDDPNALEIELDAEYNLPLVGSGTLRYSLRLMPSLMGYIIDKESLVQLAGNNIEPYLNVTHPVPLNDRLALPQTVRKGAVPSLFCQDSTNSDV